MRISILLALGLAYVAVAPRTTAAQSAIDSDATVVELRVSCAMPGGTTLDNCFETSADVTDWLWGTGPGTRNSEPNSLDQVTVRVGPGTFDPFDCEGSGARGFVSVQGAGRDVSRFVNPSSQTGGLELASVCPGGITVQSCTGLSFQNLTAQGLGTGVIWTGDGTSRWEGVDMLADNEGAPVCFSSAFGWYDFNSVGSLHFFWNTRFEARFSGVFTGMAFQGRGESWVYASDFLLRQQGAFGASTNSAVLSGAPSGVRIFGSTVRAKVENPSFAGMVTGLKAQGGSIHMHGGIVNVDSSAAAAGSVAAIFTSFSGASSVHTPDTAFVVKAAQGATAYRILRIGGTVDSPFLWPASTSAPAILSQNGSDLFVKTNEGPNQDESHLFVYDGSCTANRWRSVTTGNCL